MPLSKARDKLRKRQERTRIRLDKRQTLKPVQPKPPAIDADGNAIPDYT